jgi:ribosomal protein S18 acetylase RimI-like enzyme
MISIVLATVNDVSLIQDIVKKTWPVAYSNIISQQQIDYMLNLFYSDVALKNSITIKNNIFLLAKDSETCIGFASIEHRYLNQSITRLHKLYILPECQGKGIGNLLLENIEKLAIKNHSNAISLNVNKYNKALLFYQKNGFEIVGEEVIDIGNNYVMDDFIMEKSMLLSN